MHQENLFIAVALFFAGSFLWLRIKNVLNRTLAAGLGIWVMGCVFWYIQASGYHKIAPIIMGLFGAIPAVTGYMMGWLYVWISGRCKKKI